MFYVQKWYIFGVKNGRVGTIRRAWSNICISHNSQETYGCAVRISLVEITINHLFKDVLTEIKLLHQKIT